MNLGQIDLPELRRRLAAGSLTFRVGSFDVCLKSSLPSVVHNIGVLYRDYPLSDPDDLVDFYVELKPPGLLRRYYRPQVCFSHDGFFPFKPLPLDQAFAMFEWGLNWCVASGTHDSLVIHGAVVERAGKAFIFPGAPGSGKSTLCAALVSRGWRLLSDEMTLAGLASGMVEPFPRPVSLKNQSIDVIAAFAADAVIGEVVRDTSKGTVAHMRPPHESIERAREPARPAAIVFPKYEAGAATELSPVSEGYAFMDVAGNCFNYHVLGREGFEYLQGLIDACDCYSLKYQHLDEAVQVLGELAE